MVQTVTALLKESRGRAIVAVATVIVIAAAYLIAGFAFASARMGAADHTLNDVISHQNSLNKNLNDVNTTFSVLSNGANYNPTAARGAVQHWVAGARTATDTITRDDSALASASVSLGDMGWLTAPSRKTLDHEGVRIAHARRALTSARIVAADYVQDGRFWIAFITSEQDLETLITASATGDWASAKTALATTTDDLDGAASLSTSPGLPSELHAVMADFKTFVVDYGRLVAASQSQNDAAITAATQAVTADWQKLGSYDFDHITTEITAFYKPLIDGFNSEMALATS